MHTRLSIEDPFEKWYDVAHVVKHTRFTHFRAELLRAHTLLCGREAPCGPGPFEGVVEKLCDAADDPPFIERRSRGESLSEPALTPSSASGVVGPPDSEAAGTLERALSDLLAT